MTMSNGYNYNGSYTSYNAGSYGADNFGQSSAGNGSSTGNNNGPQLRRRNVENAAHSSSSNEDFSDKYRKRNMVKNLDFMFPKVDTEYTVQTDRGGVAFVVACVVICILCLAETISWRAQNATTVEHVVVDTSLGKRMQVNLNITFPALACTDVHVDIMDVAGDSQLDLDQSFITKTRLALDGRVAGEQERDSANKHRKQQEDVIQHIQSKQLPENYCGPCYGSQAKDDQCCNTCDELISAYKAKRWNALDILENSEQCIREGRNNQNSNRGPKKLTVGEGCNLVGHMTLNRVAGNFHIAMGEGIQRNGKHVHIFNPEETELFNASHVIHHLSFGGHGIGGDWSRAPGTPTGVRNEETPLNGVTKIVEHRHGTTGLFQYFIKIVPTTYVTPKQSSGWFWSSSAPSDDDERLETNGFFFTERFRPLMAEYMEHTDASVEEEEEHGREGHLAAAAGHSGKHSSHGHHNVKTNSILPGVFFIYEIYPFAVEVRPNNVPVTHLLIRLMATIGGVFAIIQFIDSLLASKPSTSSRR